MDDDDLKELMSYRELVEADAKENTVDPEIDDEPGPRVVPRKAPRKRKRKRATLEDEEAGGGDPEDGIEDEDDGHESEDCMAAEHAGVLARVRRLVNRGDDNNTEAKTVRLRARIARQQQRGPVAYEPTSLPAPDLNPTFNIRRCMSDSMQHFKVPVAFRKKVEAEALEASQIKRARYEESKRVFLNDVIQGYCNYNSNHRCDRCSVSASYWINGEKLDPKHCRSFNKGIIYERFRVFYSDAEKLPDQSGINWHNFVVSDRLRFSCVQYLPCFYMAADIVELLCAQRAFVDHLHQHQLGRRFADFLLFGLQFYATENALRQIAQRLLPEVKLLGYTLPDSIAPLADAVKSKAPSIRKKRVLRYIKHVIRYILRLTDGTPAKEANTILFTRLIVLGLRRFG